MKSIDERVGRLEKKTGYVRGRVPGTSLNRVITDRGIEWCLSLGLMQEIKRFFTGKTIEECLKKAERELI